MIRTQLTQREKPMLGRKVKDSISKTVPGLVYSIKDMVNALARGDELPRINRIGQYDNTYDVSELDPTNVKGFDFVQAFELANILSEKKRLYEADLKRIKDEEVRKQKEMEFQKLVNEEVEKRLKEKP